MVRRRQRHSPVVGHPDDWITNICNATKGTWNDCVAMQSEEEIGNVNLESEIDLRPVASSYKGQSFQVHFMVVQLMIGTATAEQAR